MAKFFHRLPERIIGLSETCRIRRYEGTKKIPSVGERTWPSSLIRVDFPPRRDPTTATHLPCATLRLAFLITVTWLSQNWKETFLSWMGMPSVPKRCPVWRRSSAKLSGRRSYFVILRSSRLVTLATSRHVGMLSSSVIFWMGPIDFPTSSKAVKMSLKLSPASFTALMVARKAPIWMLPVTTPSPAKLMYAATRMLEIQPGK
mmetsp:Transcript_121317/g.354618  ORF Transcript_121317/g.354618 Transcript_121317/m.354618 type:complete len:203 (-) Transcript_121317:174-782(-)